MGNWFSDTWKDLTQPGWRQAEDANALNQQALGQQASAEAFKQSQAKDMENMANTFLYGKSNADGSMSQQGAVSQADSWMKDFLSYLKDSPDTTFANQRGKLERSAADARTTLSQNMSRRGLTSSGLSAGGMSGIDMKAGQGVADLMGQRDDRKRQNLATGAQTTQTLLDRALNMYSGAKAGLMGLNTQIPGMTQNMANQALNTTQQPGVLQSLAGNYAKNTLSDYLSNTAGWSENAGGNFFTKALGMFGL